MGMTVTSVFGMSGVVLYGLVMSGHVCPCFVLLLPGHVSSILALAGFFWPGRS